VEILSKILDTNTTYQQQTTTNIVDDETQQQVNSNNNANIIDDNNNNNTLSDIYINAFIKALTTIDATFTTLSFSEKVSSFISLTSTPCKQTLLGALIALYYLIKKHNQQIEESQHLQIITSILSLLEQHAQHEEPLLVLCLEICSLYGPIDHIVNKIDLITSFITDFHYPKLQRASFHCLLNLEYQGIKALVDMVSKDTNTDELQLYILNNLIQTPHIQSNVIGKALLNEVYSGNSDKRIIALSALSRMHDLIGDDDTIEIMLQLFQEPKIKKDYVASILRTCGYEGEVVLLDELKTNKNEEVRNAIVNALSYRTPKQPKYLTIILDKNDTYAHSNYLPGSFCTYHGDVSPFIENKHFTIEQLLESEEMLDISTLNVNQPNDNTKEQVLEVNTRDFLAAIQRMLGINYDHSNPRLVHNGKPHTLDNIDVLNNKDNIISKYKSFFELTQDNNSNTNNEVSTSYEVNDNNMYMCSDECIKALIKSLQDYSPKVRETAATSLGIIGLPEALYAKDALITRMLHETDINVKSKLIWAIGRIAEETDDSIIPYILETTKNGMWKIKRASLYALSQMGDRCASIALPYLIKLLKESAINKQIIAETIVHLGMEGESVLLKLMTHEKDDNYKLKSAIIRAFAFVDTSSNNFDFVVECVFRHGKSNNILIRKAAIFTIKALSDRTEDKVPTYLKKKNIIPFYYDKLKDRDIHIQKFAIACISQLGEVGEMVLVEGYLNDPNTIIRTNCAIGLGEFGGKYFKVLVEGLLQENEGVFREVVEKVIKSKFTVDDVIGCLDKDGKWEVKEVCEKVIREHKVGNESVIRFLMEVIEGVEKE
jgi:HEAT repeat protein